MEVRSLPYNYSVMVNRASLLSTFPGSLFDVTLELDPTAQIIDIPNPVVTSDVLDIIKVLTETSNPIDINMNKELKRAEDYLNINFLLVSALRDSQYPKMISRYPRFELTNTKILMNPNVYNYLMTFAIDNDAHYIGKYLTNLVPLNKYDFPLLIYAIEHKASDFVDLLLRKGVDPSADNNKAILYAGDINTVNRLLQDPRVNPGIFEGKILLYKDTEVVERLLQDPRVDPKQVQTTLLWRTLDFNDIP